MPNSAASRRSWRVSGPKSICSMGFPARSYLTMRGRFSARFASRANSFQRPETNLAHSCSDAKTVARSSAPSRSPSNTSRPRSSAKKSAPSMPLKSSSRAISHPQLLEREPALFIHGDGVFVLKRQTDVVEALEQTFAAEWINRKAEFVAPVVHDPLPFQVNCQFIAGNGARRREEAVDFAFGKLHRQQTVLETVVVEDVGV